MEKELFRKSVLECIKFTLFNTEGKDRACADTLRDEFLAEFENKKICHFWIDLSHVESINSSFIGVIAFMRNKLLNEGEIVILGANERVFSVLDITGLSKLPNIHVVPHKEIING